MRKDKNETNLKGHTKKQKVLLPPFMASGFNMKTSAWFNVRLPEMLWAVLIISELDREVALDFFRYIAHFVRKNPECFSVTLTGIGEWDESKRKAFLSYMIGYSESIKDILRGMLLFPGLPAFSDWKDVLPEPIPGADWAILGNAVGKTFWHQSQEATDCRWVKILCMTVSGKMVFTERTKHVAQGILEYPDYGDMRSVRPQIRASEIGMEDDPKWALDFWDTCLESTHCIPEQVNGGEIQKRRQESLKRMAKCKKPILEQCKNANKTIMTHFINNGRALAVDARNDGMFGLVLYAISLLEEIVFYDSSLSTSGRLILRALVEARITLEYLLKKEKTEPAIWEDYRGYGAGQMKLIYMKLEELGENPGAIPLEEIEFIANEDKWVEFTPINLGHWDSSNLRKMSEEVGLKLLYDKFYDYTSCFMHGNWGAIRSSVYQRCVNPLHRFHRIPAFTLPVMSDVTIDAMNIVNGMIAALGKVYPECVVEIKTPTK